MEIRLLEYFLAVAREENITHAANTLHITQPTLSLQLKSLEQELGKPLFVRGKRKVTLTEDGVILRRRAEEILSLVKIAEQEISSSEHDIRGTVSIGSGETEAMNLALKAAADLQAQHPNVRFQLFNGDAQAITERLDQGLLDFGILMEPVDHSKYAHISLPISDSWGVLMPCDHILASKDNISPADLYDVPLIIPNRSELQMELSAWFQKDISQLHISATFNLVHTASLSVRNKLGCALALKNSTYAEQEQGLCFRPLRPSVEEKLCIAWKKYQAFSKAAELYKDNVSAIFAR